MLSSRTPADRDLDGFATLRGPRRRGMVMLGAGVLSASILGTIVGHLLSAPSPI